jgi:hypothetical protein
MIELDKVTREEFAALLNQDFEIATEAGALPMRLVDVRPLGGAGPGSKRTPFALTFRAAPDVRLPQCIYRVSHAQLGALDIFIVPIAVATDGALFEAVFN